MKRTASVTLPLLLPLIFILNSTAGKAQVLKPSAMLTMKGHMVTSSANNKTYQLYVSLPASYNPTDSVHYPVLYVLDASTTFPLITMRQAMDFDRELEGLIIVAIGDSLQSTVTWFTSRWTDYTPSIDVKYDSAGAKGFGLPPGSLKSGGASAFLATLKNDIIPFIDKTYKTTADRGISGHSLGGLFAAYCLLNAPGVFQRYGINSPSLIWNNKELLLFEQSFAKQHKVLRAKVFISAGGSEPELMVPNMTAFAEALKMHNYKDLSLTQQVFENETHLSVIPASLSRTLRVLYGIKPK